MKRYKALLLFLLISLCSVVFTACQQPLPQPSFQGRVSAVTGDSVTLELTSGEEIMSSGDKVMFSTKELEAMAVEVGDLVEVMYDGTIMESYPLQVKPLSWRLIEQTGALASS